MRLPVFLVAASLALAGCLGSEPAVETAGASDGAAASSTPTSAASASSAAEATAAASADPDASPPPVPLVEPTSGAVDMTVIGACVMDDDGYSCVGASGGTREQTFRVSGAPASGIFTFSWAAATPMTQEMNVYVRAGESYYAAGGQSPLELRVEDLPTGTNDVGTWFAGLLGAGVVAGAVEQSVEWSFAPATA